MVHEVSCTTSLNLSLARDLNYPRNHLLDLRDQDLDHERHQQEMEEKSSMIVYDELIPSLTLGLGRDHESGQHPIKLNQQATSNSLVSAVSSFSNSASAKRAERDGGGEEVEKMVSDIDQDEFEGGGSKKKLRLTKEQSFVLEETFKQHCTLNPKQKQNLAKSLNLRPRQVEVWFQNRRARTKLKQNEVDCALLKKCCESLTSDNRRLKKEIQELKSVKTTTISPQFYMQFPVATRIMCPSCERIVSGSGSGGNDTTMPSKTPFSGATKPHSHLFSQLY